MLCYLFAIYSSDAEKNWMWPCAVRHAHGRIRAAKSGGIARSLPNEWTLSVCPVSFSGLYDQHLSAPHTLFSKHVTLGPCKRPHAVRSPKYQLQPNKGLLPS